MKASNATKLYSYCLSSSSWRVRIALNLKRVKYEYIGVNLSQNEQINPNFININPMKVGFNIGFKFYPIFFIIESSLP